MMFISRGYQKRSEIRRASQISTLNFKLLYKLMVDGKYYFLFYVNLGRTTAILAFLIVRVLFHKAFYLKRKLVWSQVVVVFLDLKRKTPRAPTLDHT